MDKNGYRPAVYVGKGCGDRYKRIRNRNKAFMHVYNSCDCYVNVLIDDIDNDTACKLEMYLIEEYRAEGIALTNCTNGGESGTFRPCSDAVKKYFSNKYKGKNNPNYNHHWTNEMKQHLSNVRKKNEVAVGVKNPKSKRIRCVETGEEFALVKDAMLKYNVKDHSNFSAALDKPTRTCAGFHWETVRYNNRKQNGRIIQ